MDGDRTFPTTRYREHPPPAALRRHLVCLWAQEVGEGSPLAQRILPDGCIDIVWIGPAAPVVVGPATAAAVAILPPGSITVGARLRPGQGPALLGPPARDLVDAVVPLDGLWGRRAAALWGPVADRPDAEGRLAAMAAALTRALPAPAADPATEAAVAWLARHPDRPIGALAKLLGISGRQLRRLLPDAAGHGPKALQRIFRLQRLLWLARDGRGRCRDLSGLAAAAGYADQAHMTREVRALAAAPASAVVGQASGALGLAGLFGDGGPD